MTVPTGVLWERDLHTAAKHTLVRALFCEVVLTKAPTATPCQPKSYGESQCLSLPMRVNRVSCRSKGTI